MIVQFFQKKESQLARGLVRNCEVCGQQYGVFRREHQCKRCLRSVCADCATDKLMTYKVGLTRKPHRNCRFCKKESDHIMQYVKLNKLSFGKMSEIGHKWVRKITKKPNIGIRHSQAKKLTKQVFDKVWDSYNYTFRQLVGLLTFDTSQTQIYHLVYEVYSTVISGSHYEQLSTVVYLAVFFLCFCTPDKAAALCLHLIDAKGLVKDRDTLIQVYLKSLHLPDESIKQMSYFLSERSQKFISTFSINYTTIENTIYIITRVIERKKVEQPFIFLSLIIEHNKETILKSDNAAHTDLLLLRNSNIEQLSAKYNLAAKVKVANYFKEGELPSSSNATMISQLQAEKPFKQAQKFSTSFTEGAPKEQEENYYQFRKQIETKSTTAFKKDKDHMQDDFGQDSFEISMINLDRQGTFEEEDSSFIGQININSPTNSFEKEIGHLSKDQEKGQGREQEKKDEDFKSYLREVNQGPAQHSQKQTLVYTFQSSHEQGQEQFNQPIISQQANQVSQRADSIKLQQQNNRTEECSRCLEMEKEILNLKQIVSRSQIQYSRKLAYEQENNKKLATNSEKKWKQYEQKLKQNRQSHEKEINLNKKRVKQIEEKCRQVEQLKNEKRQAVKRYQDQEDSLKSSQTRQQQNQTTIKMLKNRIETLSVTSMKTAASESHNRQSKNLTEVLKNTLKQKNHQLEEQMKKNKLLTFQLEETKRTANHDPEKTDAQAKLAKALAEKSDLMNKIKEISEFLIKEEMQALEMNEENFALKEILKSNNIDY